MLRPAKIRIIREAIVTLLDQADRDFLAAQRDKRAFAESIAWELANAGYCSQDEYERDVLPYLLEESDYLDHLRTATLAGESVAPEELTLFSELLRTIGKQIRQARKEKGWSQAQLAEAAGTFQPVVSRVERGESLKQPTLELLDRVAKAMGKRVVVQLAEDEGGQRSSQDDRQGRRLRKATGRH